MRPPGGRSVRPTVAAIAAALGLAGCGIAEGPAEPNVCVAPVIWSASVERNPTNVLSAFVVASVREADSMKVRYGSGAALDSVTPALTANGDSVVVPVLGLLPSTRYVLQLVAFNRCGTGTSLPLSFTTEAVPADIPSYTASGSAPSPGYIVISAGRYGLVIDNTGRVVWYHRFPNGPGLNFQAQANGRYVARPPTTPGEDGVWIELAPDGTVTRTFGCARGLQPRMHDVIVLPDGSYWLLCDEIRTMDLTAQGASPQARVLGTSVQQRNVRGDVLFDWSPFDHLAVELSALEPDDRAGLVINWTHGNAIDLDLDGSLYLSFRNLSEVTKIDPRTGAVVWRMGGARNQMRFENGDAPAFARQHGVRMTDGGLVLLDNLGHAGGSRAERYAIDDARRTARLIGFYDSRAGVIAEVGGTTQPLPAGHTLVSFGSGGGVAEYDAAGTVVWSLMGNPGYIFRAQRIRSLYRPGFGYQR